MGTQERVRSLVCGFYTAVARGERSGCGCSVPAEGVRDDSGHACGTAGGIPVEADIGLGCGSPVAYAHVTTGETVLDLGSGAGYDVFLAARDVGPTGRVIGVDMTPAMVERARQIAVRGGFDHVEFRLGEIEDLPVADESVDVVISNCVINLSPAKDQVFREVWRALRPGGRLAVSDIVLLVPLPPEVSDSAAAYVACIAGASLRDDYLSLIREAGFEPVEVVDERRFDVATQILGCPRGDAVCSLTVRAVKP